MLMELLPGTRADIARAFGKKATLPTWHVGKPMPEIRFPLHWLEESSFAGDCGLPSPFSCERYAIFVRSCPIE
ncbi:hypothetical protein ACTDI4_00945 [Mesorhizobium sp. PUT5]|uniref:hypothetical protein n=1 Tax=Mesorhizobium sp. PUT5 TaxID=3454629 RepID=UPI003FA47A17